jgi:hypothetical protein
MVSFVRENIERNGEGFTAQVVRMWAYVQDRKQKKYKESLLNRMMKI